MYTATWNGKVIAKSDKTVGNRRKPSTSHSTRSQRHYLTDSELQTSCPWKGTASYFNLNVDGANQQRLGLDLQETPKDGAASIAGHVAFYRMVEVSLRASSLAGIRPLIEFRDVTKTYGEELPQVCDFSLTAPERQNHRAHGTFGFRVNNASSRS